MVVSAKSRIGNNGIYRVRDTKVILGIILSVVVVAIPAFFVNTSIVAGFMGNRKNSFGDFLGFVALFGLIDVLLVGLSFRMKAVWEGVKLDLNERTIEFSGGGVSANDMIDYIKPSFLLQYFTRFRINLDEVSQMNMDSITTQRWDKGLNRWIYDTTYYIKFSGTFGAASVTFLSEGKCRELYTAIRQLNEMGDPIFMA